MPAWLLGLGGKLLAALALVGAALGFLSRVKKAGRDEEKVRQEEAWREIQTRVDTATAAVDRLDDDAVRDRLRRRVAAARAGDPVQRGDAGAKRD